DSAAVRLRLVSCYVVLRQKDAARRLIDSVLQRWPDMPTAQAARGELALLEGKPEEAESWLRRSLAAAPAQYEVRYQLYRCLIQLRRDEEARVEEGRVEELKKDARR